MKKQHIQYMEKNTLDILEETDINKIQQELKKAKQQNQLKQMRDSSASSNNNNNNSNNHNNNNSKRPSMKKRLSSKHPNINNQ